MPSAVKSFRQLVGAPPSTISTNDSTLVIIDAQNEYANGLLETVNISQTRAAISAALSKYRSSSNSHSGKNIVHVVHQTPDGAPVFTPGTKLAAEFDELKAKAGEKTITKQFPSAFAKTDLDEYLQGLGDVGKKVVLAGYMAHVCVSTTARAADEMGYEVVILEDAVGDRDIPGVGGAEVTRIVLAELADAFGTVLKIEDIKDE